MQSTLLLVRLSNFSLILRRFCSASSVGETNSVQSSAKATASTSLLLTSGWLLSTGSVFSSSPQAAARSEIDKRPIKKCLDIYSLRIDFYGLRFDDSDGIEQHGRRQFSPAWPRASKDYARS